MSDLRTRLLAVDTPALSDALDRHRIDGQCVGVLPIDRSFRFAAPAFTVRMLPAGIAGKSVGDYIDEVPFAHAVVIDNGGRLDATVWGDILTSTAVRSGLAATVIDGVCRDSDRCLEVGYPVYARSRTMRTGKDRVSAEAYNEPIQIAGVRVEAGDWLVGDADGVVAIPASRLEVVLETAEEVAAAEDRIRSNLESGQRLDVLRDQTGYHALQAAPGGTSQ